MERRSFKHAPQLAHTTARPRGNLAQALLRNAALGCPRAQGRPAPTAVAASAQELRPTDRADLLNQIADIRERKSRHESDHESEP